MSQTFISEVSKFPEGESFIILRPKSIHIPGDQRSREAPGHGYPASSEDCWDLILFDSREEWEDEIKKLTNQSQQFVPLAGTRPVITTTTSVFIT